MNLIGWALIFCGCVIAIASYLKFIPEENISLAFIALFFGVIILLFEAAFGKRKK